MTVFSYLIVGHFIGDFLFQTNWMALHKAKKWSPLLIHCLVYTGIVVCVAFIGGFKLPIGAVLFLFLSHVVLDRRTFVVWWAHHVMGAIDSKLAWLTIVADQVFHLVVLAVVAHLWF